MSDRDILRINDEISRKFTRVEAALAGCTTAAELCETLLAAIEREFAVPFVWLTLLRLPDTEGLRRHLAASALLCDRLNVLPPEAFREVIPEGLVPLLAGGDLRPYFRLLPPTRKYLLRSLAVSPLTLEGRLIGSLNHGDAAAGRYEPGMETSRLRRLARLVSRRLGELADSFSP